MLRRLANGWRPGSPAARLRQKRFALFLDLLKTLPAPVDILDIGGQEAFWKVVGVEHPQIHSVTLFNLWNEPVSLRKLKFTTGDTRDLSQYADQSVDVIFSNSVIEHVGGLRDQKRMADEIRRVAKAYFVQTPNRYFPIEPHFLIPFFQFLPQYLRAQLHHRFTLGWWKRQSNYFEARAEVESIRLLSFAEFQALFPDATIYQERVAMLTKSFIAFGGWDKEVQPLMKEIGPGQ